MESRVDRAEIAAALGVLVRPGDVTELRALDAVVGSDKYPRTYSGYFNDHDALASAASSIQFAKGIYITPNPVNPALLSRAQNRLKRAGRGETTSDGDIVRRQWLLIDTDARRPGGISATDVERDAAIEHARQIYKYLKDQGWPDPIAADSGNGGHLMYAIDIPVEDGGLVQRCLHELARRFDDGAVKVDQTVHNPSRIWKLYGTMACKGDSTDERPHRMAKILSMPDVIVTVPVEKLGLFAETANPTAGQGGQTEQAFDIEEFVATNSLPVTGPEPWKDKNGGAGRRWVFDVCPWNPDHTNGSAYILQFENGAIAAGCHHNGCADKNWADMRAMYPSPEICAAPKGGDLARIEYIPASQLGEGDDVDWAWQGWLARGHSTLLVGIWKSGKSTLVGHYLKAAAQAGSIAGEITQHRVLVITEESRGLWARRRDDLGFDDSITFVIKPFKGRPRRADWESFVQGVAEDVRAGMFDAVVIDTWQSVSPCHDENDAAGMVAALSPLHHIMDAGAAVLLIHHARKGDGNEGQASRGSGALTGFVDIIVEFRRFDRERQEDRRRVLKSYSRFDETPAEVVIELQDGGYRLVGTKGDANREDRVEVIRELLSESLATADELRERWPEGDVAKPSKRTLQTDLNAGADDGLWDRSGKGVKGSPFKYRRFDSRKPTPLEGESNPNAAVEAIGDDPTVNGVVPKEDREIPVALGEGES